MRLRINIVWEATSVIDWHHSCCRQRVWVQQPLGQAMTLQQNARRANFAYAVRL